MTVGRGVIGVVILSALLGGVFFAWAKERPITRSVHPTLSGQASTSILFVGDVMLARYVEKHMREQGSEYPYQNFNTLVASSTYAVGNFEGTIPRVHQPTKPMTFRFSVDLALARTLKRAGFTHMFMANNHAYDFGSDAYLYARFVLEQSGIKTGGHPFREVKNDARVITLSGSRIAIIPIHAVYRAPNEEDLRATFAAYATSTDMQIAYIHWGNEYEPLHSKEQEKLAHTLIDMGADAVVGHHPHVIQDIDSYKDVPIFYSLGNFIFDQYWDDAVRTGLALRLHNDQGHFSWELIPTWSERSNPTPLAGVDRARVLEAIARRSTPLLAPAIRTGVIGHEVHIAQEKE